MTNSISGKILVQELNRGVANLVVAAYDVDSKSEHSSNSEHGSRTQILQRLAYFMGGNGGEDPQDVYQWWDSLEWDRLGSVLTARDGSFQLDFEDDLFKRRDATEARPDYVLFVLAPEDPMKEEALSFFAAHPLPRLLHFSWVIRGGAGRKESYLIRLAQVDLDARRIPYGESVGDGHAVAVARAKERVASSATAHSDFRAATTSVATKLSETSREAAGVMESARLLQPVPTGHLFVHDPAMRVTLQREVANEGLARLHGGLSLHLPKLSVGAEVTPEAANAAIADPDRSVDLTRTRSLFDTCLARDELRTLLATPAVVPGTDNTGVEPEAPSEDVTREEAERILRSRAIGQIADLPSATSRALIERLRSSKRATVSTLGARLDEIELKGGPADAVAYHDFHSLQLAFRSIWRRVFDQGVNGRGEELYERWVAVRRFAGLGEPSNAARAELADLKTFLSRVQRDTSLAAGIAQRTGTLPEWDGSSQPFESFFGRFFPPLPPIPGVSSSGLPKPPSPRDPFGSIFGPFAGLFGGSSEEERKSAALDSSPVPPNDHLLGRISGLTLDLAKRLSETYQFDVFEPGSYNFGLLTTYRQRWEPLSYQAGELVASVPLAPGEKRKLVTRETVKSKRRETRAEASSSQSKFESSQTSRADAEIVNRASSTTNFNQSVQGEFSFGDFLSLTTTTQFSNSQERHSEQRKKDFRESVRKAADEYKRERKLEIKTVEEFEAATEETQEILNPNTEITVTYLFYELQRRYKVSEHLHRVRPVILVAQDVPAPDQIDEAFLVAHEWIIRRALLDESLVSALDYLTAEFPGDEFGVAVLRTTWERNLQIVDRISMHLDARSALRDRVRTRVLELLQGTTTDETGGDVAAAIFSGGLSLLFGGGENEGAKLAAARDSADRELEFTESEMAETERRLKQAMSALEESTQKYVEATRAQLNRRTAIDQLRVHVKQNILHYMQAIWSHEPPDQRFFRLYDSPIDWFEVETAPSTPLPPARVRSERRTAGTDDAGSLLSLLFGLGGAKSFVDLAGGFLRLVPDGRRLGEVADLDMLLGFKGNYMIFPLKESNALTEHMMQEYQSDEVLGLLDPDDFANITNDELAAAIRCARDEGTLTGPALSEAEDLLLDRLTKARRDTEEIIVPTGQLFIEALPGEHAVLEDFKLVHRQLDAEKVDAEARFAYVEAIRAASRLNVGELDDPNTDRLIQVRGASPGIDVET